ncbi:Cys-tRNA(Pro) deacylase [Mordavella massiliensis]|uniref:Cys-tRNA(Pro)/Cys-tRNA(Cys) deacylase n=1 Tax=Mordavella massiliensis TaxID=1871024 RepID=A0A938XC55_9CLOT|nr:Cys-tRNA(Pro) deacylase [Mordavella massiliensis]MBM6947507.1 Cys-tRNA(Pro) deacylase [Mordavella massiliensis]
MSKKELKTNAMRMLDREKIPYIYETYDCGTFTDGIHVADQLGLPHGQVYKTLVTVGKTGAHYVFVIPIASEIDFKKAARAVGEKSVEMLPLKDLTKVTGYVRGGCTSIGMKKQFPTVIQADAETLDQIYISGGKLGMQLRLSPRDLQKVTGAAFADVTAEESLDG